MCARVYVCVIVFVRTCVCICVYIQALLLVGSSDICKHTYISVYVCMSVHMYVYTYISRALFMATSSICSVPPPVTGTQQKCTPANIHRVQALSINPLGKGEANALAPRLSSTTQFFLIIQHGHDNRQPLPLLLFSYSPLPVLLFCYSPSRKQIRAAHPKGNDVMELSCFFCLICFFGFSHRWRP